MEVSLRLLPREDASLLASMWPLYVHDIAAFDGRVPNRHGMLTDDEACADLVTQGEGVHGWWQDSSMLFPYLIEVDGRAAGFNLIASNPFPTVRSHCDHLVHEFFVHHAWRGTNVAERAAQLGFEAHSGRWEVYTYPTHQRAIGFWRRVVKGASRGEFSEAPEELEWGQRVVWNFQSPGSSGA